MHLIQPHTYQNIQGNYIFNEMNWKHSPEAELKEFEPRLKLRRSSIMDGSI